MFKLSKSRVEAFSDGVIAIIITIMVLNIPLPTTFGLTEITGLLRSILIFFVSFFIVGIYWNKHHLLFENLQEVSNKIIWQNLFFLFVLSLIPIFAKWVMENPNETVPAIGYDLVYLLVNISYYFMWSGVSQRRDDQKGRKGIASLPARERYRWLVRWIVMVAAIAAIIVFSLSFPRLSLIFFIALPVVFSLFNLFFEREPYDRAP